MGSFEPPRKYPTKLPDICAFIKEKLDKAPLDEDGEVPNTDPADNYAGVFLSHAEVYRFAYITDWVSLCALSLYRLIRSLASFTLFEERTGDIVKLLKFVFEENEYMHEMQDVLVDYAAWNVEILMPDADFRQLLNRVPSLETAIFRSMWSASGLSLLGGDVAAEAEKKLRAAVPPQSTKQWHSARRAKHFRSHNYVGRKLRSEVGDAFSSVSSLLGGSTEGKKGKPDTVSRARTVTALLDFAEGSQRFQSRAPRGQPNTGSGN
ncbi:hypothetical protein CNMCM6106_001024 [Aspergillus hiratsukae]|uniref:Uncharacterized protein n=1 Tax=Aspergillus hiratsukae TaxID=1194566 RepID=A0A8H6Q000_9EURO|nr:hypothetical protein CNMCM6106_001024 [Aspergillus hiratsukae]